MPLGDEYLGAIRRFEGFHSRPYWDYRQWTSGYGTRAGGPGEVIDRDEADRRFRGELGQSLGSVRGMGVTMTPGQEAALTSLTYNAGPGWQRSGLGAAVRAGDWRQARERFLQYVNAGGRPLPGLVRRRTAEAAWLDGQPSASTGAPLGAPVALPVASAGASPLSVEGASPASAGWLQRVGSGLMGALVPSAQAEVPPVAPPSAGMVGPEPIATPMPVPGAPPFTPRPDPRGLGVLGLPRMTPMPPSATVPPFGAPTVTSVPTSELDTLGYGPSEIQAPGRDITREMVEGGLPPAPPPPVDADAIVRGAETAAADRAAQPAQPGYFERLMSNPAFLAGMSILGTAPGGNWGPAGAQAASQAIRGGREAEEWRRLQARRATQDRIWREAFGPNGQPTAGHPLLTGMPPEMAATIYAMGAEEGLPAAQRWQMFRGQQQEQIRMREGNLAMFGIGPPQAPPMPSDGALAGAVSDRLNAAAGLPGAPQDTSGVGGAPLPGTRPPITPPAGSGVSVAPPVAAPTVPPASQPVAPSGGRPPVMVTIGRRTMPAEEWRAYAATQPDGPRAVIEHAITAAEREAQPPEAIRTRALTVDQAYRSLTTSLENYAQLVGRTGASVLPGQEADEIQQARTNILLQLKELYNLGVLNGPDLALMERMVYDPSVSVMGGGPFGLLPSGVATGIGAFTNGNIGIPTPAARARSSIDRLQGMLRTIRDSAVGAAGMPPTARPGSGAQTPGSGANDPLGIR